MRLHCDRCGETYDEDNLYECARCKRDVCWKCGILAEIPEIAPGNAWCDWCLGEVGRTDLLKGKRHEEPTKEDKQNAALRILTAAGYTLGTEIAWKSDEGDNERLTEALKTMGLNVDNDCSDFETAPWNLPAESGSLILTERGYDRLRAAILAALS